MAGPAGLATGVAGFVAGAAGLAGSALGVAGLASATAGLAGAEAGAAGFPGMAGFAGTAADDGIAGAAGAAGFAAAGTAGAAFDSIAGLAGMLGAAGLAMGTVALSCGRAGDAAIGRVASGIGLAICKRLRAEGAIPLLLDFNAQSLASAVREVYPEASADARYGYLLDVRDSKAVDACFADIRRDHGPVTHAVANAGIAQGASLLDITDEQWQQVMSVNLNGVMYFCRAAARQMSEGVRS